VILSKENKRQRRQHLMKRLTEGKNQPEAIAFALDEAINRDQPKDGILSDLVGCFLELREAIKQNPLSPVYPLSTFITAFQNAVKGFEINPEQFYAKLLERMMVETESGEDHKALPRQATRERILDAALGVFSEKGFHVATMDEVADRAGVGKGTLYRYFANKEALFNELVRQRLEELETKARTILDGQDDVLTMITKYVRVYFEFFDQNQSLYRLIVQERHDIGGQVQDLYLKQVKRRVLVLRKKVFEAGQQGLLKPLDFETVFYGVMGFIHGIIQKWLAHECSYSLVNELPSVLEVLFYGFVSHRETEKNVD
jgi:AcrR family transcriptional regulator